MAVALIGCQRPTPSVETVHAPSQRLAAIDTLMQSRPDSALTLLLDSTINDPYYQLWLAEALYKNYYDQINRSDLLDAMAYYDSLCGRDAARHVSTNDVFLLARCHYMNGIGFYEMDSVVLACQEYMKALDIMEEQLPEKEVVGYKAKFMALINTHLEKLYSELYLHEQALFFGKQALVYYQKYEAEKWHIAWILEEIGMQYDMMDNDDTASIYYNEGLGILADTNSAVYRDILSKISLLSCINNHTNKTALQQLYKLLNQAENEQERLLRHSIIGEVYFHNAQFDSAWIHLQMVYENSNNNELKKQVAEWLVEICKVQSRDIEIFKYADFLVPFANLEENKSWIKSRLTEFYKTYVLKKQERKYLLENKNLRKRKLVVLGGLFLIVVPIVLVVHKIKTNKIDALFKQERYTHEIQQKALLGKLKTSNEALRNSIKRIENLSYMDSAEQTNFIKDYSAFMAEPICRSILDTVHQQCFKSKIDFVLYKEYSLNKEQILALRLAADRKMDRFTVRIRKRFPDLNDDDVTYCCFYLLGLSEADISALMQKAYPTVSERKRKIKRIIGEENDLLFSLRNLV